MRQTPRITLAALWLVFVATGAGCGDSGNGPPDGSGGKVGSGGSAATGGVGSGGTAGQPSNGSGGHGGGSTGGKLGTGGAAATGGGSGGVATGGGSGGVATGGGGAGAATGGHGGSGAQAGAGGRGGKGGTTGTGASGGSHPETGRLSGITAAHNAVRAAVDTTTALPPFTWSDTLAQYAQQWADSLAATSCNSPHHRSSQELDQVGYGENLYVSISSVGGSTAQQVVDGWAAEKACYTFGMFMKTDKCDTACYTKLNSDGCGHYTQIVWRTSTEVGCGVATCQNGGKEDIWICNYKPPGNYIGRNPY